MAHTTVSTFAALKLAAQDVNIDYIYLDGDITIGSGGILLEKNKPSLVIDGINPLDENQTIHTITDINDLNQGNTIRVNSTVGTYHLTIKNCKVIGRNYYGIISSINSSNQATTTLTLENIEYSGPQAVYNRHGLVEIIGGNYRIGKLNDTVASSNELAETNRIVMKGIIDVHHEGTPNSCMYLTNSSPSFTIKENCILNVETVDRELFYVDAGGMDFTMEPNSKINANMNWSMFYSTGMHASSFVMGEGAQLIYNQKSARGCPTINCSGNLILHPNSRLIVIKKDFSSSESLLHFTTAANATFMSPESVVLYNPSGKTISSALNSTINISAEIINYWQNATPFPDAGGFNDTPLHNWTKANGENATIDASLNSVSMLSVNSNLIAGVDTNTVPSTTTFNLQTAHVLAFGQLPLEVLTPHESDVLIIGSSLTGANLRATVNSSEPYSTIDYFGTFSIRIDEPIDKHDTVVVEANMDFKTKRQTFDAEGTLEMTVPQRLPFVRVASPTRLPLHKRVDDNWSIVVRDSRDNGSDWTLNAHASSPLSSGTAELTNALVYKSGEMTNSLEGAEPIVIYNGTGNTDPDYTETTITWSEIEGILLRLQTDTSYETGHYETSIDFTLTEDENP